MQARSSRRAVRLLHGVAPSAAAFALGASAVALAAAAAAGCFAAPVDGRAPVPAPVIAVCIVPVDGWGEAPDPPISWLGRVTGAGSGETPGSCWTEGWMGAFPRRPPDGDQVWFRALAEDGRDWIVGFGAPGARPPAGESDMVFVSAGWPGLLVREMAGPLRAWIALVPEDGSFVFDAAAPGVPLLAFQPYARAFSQGSGCARHVALDLLAEVGLEDRILPFGEEVELGGWRIIHGGAYEPDPAFRLGGCEGGAVPPTIVAFLLP